MKQLGGNKRQTKYEKVMLTAIDEALLTLGENVRTAIYFHLETKFSLPKNEIPTRITDFSDALEKIFGLASKKIEILIMKFLNDQVKCDYEWTGPSWLVPNLTFEGYAQLVKTTIESNKKLEETPLDEKE